ncbi:hypothetical protein EVA_12859, partial [gut metagenome]
MVKVLRCPACGALWRISDEESSALLHCSECQSVFAADKAESVRVDETLLQSRLDKARNEEERLKQQAKEADITLSHLAEELSEFSEEKADDTGKEETAVSPPAQPPATPPQRNSALWGVIIVIAILILSAVALLAGHQTVLRAMPPLRGVYENVCTQLPCPGFVWMNADAFSITTSLENPEDSENPLDQEMAALMPIVSAKLLNNSVHPQYLPILEMKLLDAAGEIMAQRILEPEEYGFAANAAVAPGEEITA